MEKIIKNILLTVLLIFFLSLVFSIGWFLDRVFNNIFG